MYSLLTTNAIILLVLGMGVITLGMALMVIPIQLALHEYASTISYAFGVASLIGSIFLILRCNYFFLAAVEIAKRRSVERESDDATD